MEQDNKSSILAFIIALPLVFCLLVSSASGAKLYTGGEKYEKDGVIALLLHLNGKMMFVSPDRGHVTAEVQAVWLDMEKDLKKKRK